MGLPALTHSLTHSGAMQQRTYGPMRFDSADRNATFRLTPTSHVVWREERYPHRIPYAVEKHCYVHYIWLTRRQRAACTQYAAADVRWHGLLWKTLRHECAVASSVQCVCVCAVTLVSESKRTVTTSSSVAQYSTL